MKILEFYSIAGHDVTRGESCADLKVPRRDSSRLNVRSPSYTPMHSHCSFLYASIVSPFIVTSNFQRPSRLSLFSSFSSVSYSLYFFLFSFFFSPPAPRVGRRAPPFTARPSRCPTFLLPPSHPLSLTHSISEYEI